MGNFLNDEFSGEGNIKYENGNSYEGEWKES